MKKLLLIISLAIFICSCGHKAHVPTQAEKEMEQHKFTDQELSLDTEKITLLSEIRNIPFDTLYSILNDYSFKLDLDPGIPAQQALTYTVARHSYSKKQIASIIFSFKYEMMSRDDILDEAPGNSSADPGDNAAYEGTN
jgi:hypothetical protein